MSTPATIPSHPLRSKGSSSKTASLIHFSGEKLLADPCRHPVAYGDLIFCSSRAGVEDGKMSPLCSFHSEPEACPSFPRGPAHAHPTGKRQHAVGADWQGRRGTDVGPVSTQSCTHSSSLASENAVKQSYRITVKSRDRKAPEQWLHTSWSLKKKLHTFIVKQKTNKWTKTKPGSEFYKKCLEFYFFLKNSKTTEHYKKTKHHYEITNGYGSSNIEWNSRRAPLQSQANKLRGIFINFSGANTLITNILAV